MKLAALFSIIAAPALACDLDGSYASAERTPYGAEVYLQNNYAASTRDEVQCVFSFGDGAAITVIWHHATGQAPDSALIIPPPGYVAIPPEAIIPEGGAVRVKIVKDASA